VDKTPPPRNIVIGQDVSDEKVRFAKRQRREMSPVERVLWHRLRGNQIGGSHFRRQQVIGPYVADFYCHSAGLAIEIDGDSHDDAEYDAARDRVFAEKGISTLRFANHQVLYELDAVLEVIWRSVKGTSP